MDTSKSLKALAELLFTGDKDNHALAQSIANGLSEAMQEVWSLWRHLQVHPQRKWSDYILFHLWSDYRPDIFYILRLNCQRITRLPADFFLLSRLHVLELADNDIRYLPNEINNLQDLLFLKLDRCALRFVPNLRLSKLLYLHLSSNPIQRLDAHFFGPLTKLKYLDLAHTRLTNLPDSLWMCAKLQVLYMPFAKLSEWTLPRGLQCTELQRVNMASNRLTSIPQTLRGLSQLSRLDLSDNQLQTFAEETAWQLRYLRLQRNLFAEFAITKELAASLAHLDLSRNQLKTLTCEPARVGLRVLHLQHNQLKNLPEVLGSAPLTSLLLHNNQLENLPKQVAGWHKLRHLNLYKNKVRKLPNYLGSQMPNLTHIVLADNDLDEVPTPIFACLNLSKIDLSHNKLTSLPEAIGRLPKLKTLILKNNNLSDLPQAIYALKYLKILDLRQNPALPTATILACRLHLPDCLVLA